MFITRRFLPFSPLIVLVLVSMLLWMTPSLAHASVPDDTIEHLLDVMGNSPMVGDFVPDTFEPAPTTLPPLELVIDRAPDVLILEHAVGVFVIEDRARIALVHPSALHPDPLMVESPHYFGRMIDLRARATSTLHVPDL